MTKPAYVPTQAEQLIEAGDAFATLAGLDNHAGRQTGSAAPEHFDVIVIGGGQAGLSVGYHLQQRGVRFVILDAHARVGDAWRKRWDSLKLFSPGRLDGLDGLPFPGPPDAFPTKDQMADYLEAYAEHFALPIRKSTQVDRLFRKHGHYCVQIGERELHADQVVIAMANFQNKRVPAFAHELRAHIVQLHSSDYRNPTQLAAGPVLVVGGGNSGAEIALDLSRTHAVRLAARPVGEVPFAPSGLLNRMLMRVVFHRILTIRTPIGRRARPKILGKATPLIRTKRADLARAGVECDAQHIVAMRDGLPVLEDGRVLDVKNVVWCTGYDNAGSWVDLPIFDDAGEPLHDAGVVSSEPGLYFVGLHFLYSMSSAMVHGVGRDAERITGVIAARAAAGSHATASAHA